MAAAFVVALQWRSSWSAESQAGSVAQEVSDGLDMRASVPAGTQVLAEVLKSSVLPVLRTGTGYLAKLRPEADGQTSEAEAEAAGKGELVRIVCSIVACQPEWSLARWSSSVLGRVTCAGR